MLRRVRVHALAVAVEPDRLNRTTKLPHEFSSADSQSAAARDPWRDRWLMAALAVALGGLIVRATGIGFGLPYHYHWDEPTVMNRVIRMGGGDLNPHFFYYPTLLMYMLLAAQGVLYAVGRALHSFASPDAFAVAYLANSTASYLVGRALVAGLGAASVLLTFIVGRRFLSPLAGLVGALLLAVSPVHIGSSHFITNDVPMAFFALLAYVFLWDVYRRGQARDYVLGGAAIGLATATKYLPVVLLFSLALAHAFRMRNETGRWQSALAGWPLLALGGLAAFVTFAVASPYVLLDWRSAIHDYAIQAGLSSAAGCQNCPPNFVTYLPKTMPWAIGWPAYLLALIGTASLAWTGGERRLRGILLASFPVILFLMVGSERQPWPRWLVPVAPFACLAAGAVLESYLRRLAAIWARFRSAEDRASSYRASSRLLGTLTAIGALALATPPALASARFDMSLLAEDPRSQAAAWFQSSVPDGATVAVQPLLDRYFFTAQLPTDSTLQTLESYLPPSRPTVRDALDREYHRGPVYHQVPFTYDVEVLRAQGVRYVVLSTAHYHQFNPSLEDRFYTALVAEATATKRFTPPVALPDADNYPISMPTITVYQLPER
jgi:hypothetical protein